MASLRHNSAMLSSPRRPSRTIRILSSDEKCRRVARRIRYNLSADKPMAVAVLQREPLPVGFYIIPPFADGEYEEALLYLILLRPEVDA